MKISEIKTQIRNIECTRHKIELEVKPYCPECEKEYNESISTEPPEANPACENCKYWQDVTNDWGYCKFNPPYIRKEQRYKYYYQAGTYDPNLIEDICHKEWVHTDKNDWCGQFEQRESK